MKGCFHRSWQRQEIQRGEPSDRETRPPTSSGHRQRQPVTLSDNSHMGAHTKREAEDK